MALWSATRLFPKADAATIYQRQSLVAEDVDFDGRGLLVQGAAVTLIRPRFRNGGGKLLTVGDGAEVTIIDGTFDGAGMTRAAAALVSCEAGGRLTLIRTTHDNAPRLHLDQAGGIVSVQGSRFGAFGMATQAGDHVEGVFIRGGEFRATGCVFDGSAGAKAVVPKTITGVLMFKPQAGDIVATLDGCEVLGSKALGGLAYPIQAGGTDKGDCALTIRGTRLERGASGFVGPTEYGGGRLTVVDGGGNVEAASRAVDLSRASSVAVAMRDDPRDAVIAELTAKLEAVRAAAA